MTLCFALNKGAEERIGEGGMCSTGGPSTDTSTHTEQGHKVAVGVEN